MPKPAVKPKKAQLAPGKLVLHPQLQQRAGGMDDLHIEDLRAVIQKGGKLPPVKVRLVPFAEVPNADTFGYAEGDTLPCVTDGYHTATAHQEENKRAVECEVLPGSWDEARLDAARANPAHGKKITQEDKRRAIEIVLTERPQWTDGTVARFLSFCTDKTVATVRATLVAKEAIEDAGEREGADGRKVKRKAPRNSGEAWRALGITELPDLPDSTRAALEGAEVATVGDCYDRLMSGDQLGLPRPAVGALTTAVLALRDGPRAKEGAATEGGKEAGKARFDFSLMDHAAGRVRRLLDDAAEGYPDWKGTAAHKGCERLFSEFWGAWQKQVKRLQKAEEKERAA